MSIHWKAKELQENVKELLAKRFKVGILPPIKYGEHHEIRQDQTRGLPSL
jgi:hypothetical protein